MAGAGTIPAPATRRPEKALELHLELDISPQCHVVTITLLGAGVAAGERRFGNVF
ncbi:MAG: hypothetical protein V3U27_00075 [Candidatus Tectomicrobia bacterium]